MGSPQNSPASPSVSRSSSSRRPNSLSLGGSSPPGSGKSPGSNSSPTKSPGSPATSTKAPRRTGSLGKGSQVTRPVAPKLSTAARSLVRPCGCGKAGHGGHGNGHKDGLSNGHHAQDAAAQNHHASPATERKERPKKSVRAPSTKAKSPPAQTPPPTSPPPQIEETENSINNISDLQETENGSNDISDLQETENSINNISDLQETENGSNDISDLQETENGSNDISDNNSNDNSNNEDISTQDPTQYSQVMCNRYISTLVWVPQMMTEKFSTTVLVSSDAPTFTDTVFIKPRYRELHHEERLLSSGTTVQTYTVQTTSPGLSTTTLALA